MNNKKMADKIARKIFECGDEPWSKVIRIQFKGNHAITLGSEESELGGLSELPLANLIYDVLEED